MKHVIVGPPRSGKSTYARLLRDSGVPTFCTDPPDKVKDFEHGVTYLPEWLDWHEGSQYVADYWLPMEGPYCIEGVGTVRAMRKYLNKGPWPDDIYVVRFSKQYMEAVSKPGQVQMAKAINTIWDEIADRIPKRNQL